MSHIIPNPDQPRRSIREESLAELAASIKEKGLLQPLIVKRKGDGYEIIAGERRYRAAVMVGLADVPAVIKDVDDREALELSLIENLQREDLSPIDVALIYQRFIDTFSYTQEELGRKLSIDRSTVANTVRLLRLPGWIQDHITAGRLTQGHARALLALRNEEEQKRVAAKILGTGVSVRETEQAVRKKAGKRPAPFGHHEADLTSHLQTRVKIAFRRNKGTITIEFYSKEDLQRLVDLVLGSGG